MLPLKRIFSTFFFIILSVILLSSKFTFGQYKDNSFIINGVVSDYQTNEKIVGVNVYLKGTTNGTAADNNGFYSLKIPKG
jgi:hypothetical protein